MNAIFFWCAVACFILAGLLLFLEDEEPGFGLALVLAAVYVAAGFLL